MAYSQIEKELIEEERPAMTKRIIIGGLISGVVMFLWGAVSHMVLRLEESALKQFEPASETPVLAAMQAGIKQSGVYFFPGMDESPNLSKEQKGAEQKKWLDKYAAGPRGLLIYRAEGEQFSFPKHLAVQLVAMIF